MAGGKGARFWPKSTDSKPKQFLNLVSSDETMLQQSYRRYRKYLEPEDVYVLTCSGYAAAVRKQLPELESDRLIIEPAQRDTGPCVALMAHYFLCRHLDEVLVTVPSDQYMADEADLHDVLLTAEQAARSEGVVVTLGIVPTRPETGYGYIRTEYGMSGLQPVVSFIEKPTKTKAEALIRQPNVYWNSGIFVWRPSTIASYMKLYRPEIWQAVDVPEEQLRDTYASLHKISVDYAIIEKVEKLLMIPISFHWDDVGSWRSLERIFPADDQGNVIRGDVYGEDIRNCIIHAEKRNVVVIGAENLIVVSTDEGVLVCHKSAEQHIKHAVQWIADKRGDRQSP